MKTVALAVLSVLLLAPVRAGAEGDGGLIEKYVLMMERISADADTHKPDCEKIGVALSRHQAEDVAFLTDLKATLAKLTSTERKAVLDLVKDKYGARLKASEARAAPLKACMTNAKVKAYDEQIMHIMR